MKTKRLSDHQAWVMAPQEAIVMRKGSTAMVAIPALLDA